MNSKLSFIILLIFSLSAFADTFADKDTNQDGRISLTEFAGDDKRLKSKFKRLDTNSDGALSEEEYAESLTEDKKAKKGKKDKKKGKKNKKDNNEDKKQEIEI